MIKKHVSKGSAKGRGLIASQKKFCDLLHARTRMRINNQILHGAQTRCEQETQLLLTNGATRLEVSQVTKHGTIPYVRYGFLLVCYSNFVRKTHRFFEIFDFKNVMTLKTGLKGPWRLLKMSPFDREPMTSYWCSIVTMALSRVVSEIFNVEEYRDLEIPTKSQSRSLKVVPFDRAPMTSY